MAGRMFNDEMFSLQREFDFKANRYTPGRIIFWRKSSSNSFSDCSKDDDFDDPVTVKKLIISAFSNFNYTDDPLEGLLQFWAPVTTTSGRRLLSTCDQPFSFEDRNSIPYRVSSIKYRYSLDPPPPLDNDNSDYIINDGVVANAFLDRFPLVVTNLGTTMHNTTPLLDKSRFPCCILLPVFSASNTCVGVVECCMNPFARLAQVLLNLKQALRAVGLVTYHARQSLPFPIKLFAVYQIQAPLTIVCQSHHLTLGQVWIRVPDSSFVVRLCGYFIDSDDFEYDTEIREYFRTCSVIPLKMGEGLPGKTLQTRDHLFAKVSDLLYDTTGGLLRALSCTTDSSSLVICLTSAGVDYAFEFLWPRTRNRLIMLEALLLTLKRCLPTSFRFPCGARLGQQLRLLDLTPPTPTTTSDTTPSSFIIFQGKTTSSTAAAEPDRVLKRKRQFRYLSCDTILVKVDYYIGPKKAAFTLQAPFTFADAKYNVERCFNMDPGTYTIEYNHFEEEKEQVLLLKNDENFSTCIKLWTDKTRQEIPLKLHVKPTYHRLKVVTI